VRCPNLFFGTHNYLKIAHCAASCAEFDRHPGDGA
jgi:hypothetical protein